MTNWGDLETRSQWVGCRDGHVGGGGKRFMRKKSEGKMKRNMIQDRMQCVERWGVKQTGAPSLPVI